VKAPADIKVLVVDDDVSLNEAITGLFQMFKFSVTSAFNGVEALKFLEEQQFDVVLSDVRMPKMDGMQLLQQIRARHHQSPCVLISSAFNDYSPAQLYGAGANGFFAKPFNASTVRESIQRAVIRPIDLWSRPPSTTVSFEVKKHFINFEAMVKSGDVKFGRGGFFVNAKIPLSQTTSSVGFQFTFDQIDKAPNINGQGLVRWSRSANSPEGDEGLGIEITHLDHECRLFLANWTESQEYQAFIPIN
jgi:CheY-like chemotaxis protein